MNIEKQISDAQQDNLSKTYANERINLILAKEKPPSPGVICFAPVDSEGSRGELNEYILSQLRLPYSTLPKGTELLEGFCFRKVKGIAICFVVTANEGSSSELMARNLYAALGRHDELQSADLWIPLMGTEHEELNADESYKITVRVLRRHLKQRQQKHISVVISLPDAIFDSSAGSFIAFAEQIFKNLQVENDALPIHRDTAATDDKLDRRPIAHNIARYLRRLWANQNRSSFMLHIHGPWGSGKTTFLEFIKEGLQDSKHRDNWVVIKFNAWQHQHISPPWWPLLDNVFTQAKLQLHDRKRFLTRPFCFSVKEKWRRLKMSGSLSLFATAIIFIVVSVALVVAYSLSQKRQIESAPSVINIPSTAPRNPDSTITVRIEQPKPQRDIWSLATSISTIVAAISGVVTGIWLFSKTIVILASARSAQSFMSLAADPMNKVKSHFNYLVKDIGHPVAIYIDDIDRCNPKYVVDLLEGIQTLFRDTGVLYLIAGDKKWISACFEDTYKTFKSSIENPGSSLGDLFIQKAFQMSTRVPYINPDQQKRFWGTLLFVQQQDDESVSSDSIERSFSSLKTEDEILSRYEQMKTQMGTPKMKLRDVVLKRLSERDVQERTEHELQAFWRYIGSNPRAMKRLVNYYNVMRDTILAEGRAVDREFLIRWLILVIDWPVLADYLEEHPECVDKIHPEHKAVPEPIRVLMKTNVVFSILKGADGHQPFTAASIRNCTGRLM